jgi:hypothetical protein
VVLGFAVLARVRPPGAALAGLVLLLGVSQGWARLAFRYETPWPEVPVSLYDRIREHDGERDDVLRAVAEAARALHGLDRPARIPFWYSYDEPLGMVFREISCTHFLRVVNEEFPSPAGPVLGGGPGSRPRWVAVLSQDPQAVFRAEAALEQLGCGARPCLWRRIHHGRIRFDLTVLEITERPACSGE